MHHSRSRESAGDETVSSLLPETFSSSVTSHQNEDALVLSLWPNDQQMWVQSLRLGLRGL